MRSRVLRPPRCHRRSHRWHIEHHRDVANGSPNLTAAGDCRAHEQFRQCLSDQGGAIGAVLVHSPTGTSLRPYALCTSTYLHAASPPPCPRLPGRACHTWYLAMVCLAAQALACDGQNSVLLSLSQRSCLQCQVGAGPAARSSPLRCNRADQAVLALALMMPCAPCAPWLLLTGRDWLQCLDCECQLSWTSLFSAQVRARACLPGSAVLFAAHCCFP